MSFRGGEAEFLGVTSFSGWRDENRSTRIIKNHPESSRIISGNLGSPSSRTIPDHHGSSRIMSGPSSVSWQKKAEFLGRHGEFLGGGYLIEDLEHRFEVGSFHRRKLVDNDDARNAE